MAFRSSVPDFALANPLYTAARVTFYTVGNDGLRTATLATLYAAPTGTQKLPNPQTLDSEGKNEAPIYIDSPVIAEVTGPNVESHTTGQINPRGTWRGDWTPATVYFSEDFVVDPVSGNVYIATNDYTSAASIATDIGAGNLRVAIDQDAVVSGGASRSIKFPVRLATTPEVGNIVLSGLQVVDGRQGNAGDRILVKNQNNPAENGFWNMAAGAWTRTVDADKSSKFTSGAIVYVLEGEQSHNKGYQLSIPTPFTLGTSPIVFAAIELPVNVISVQFRCPPDANMQPGFKGYVPIPYDCQIEACALYADRVGSVVIDIYRAGAGDFPPDSSDTITGSSKPTLSASQSSKDSSLAGWTKTLKAGDVLAFDMLSVTGIKFVDLSLTVNRN